ncbi:hypothetical protein V6N12_017306 [Hibiscus sabdariffa]|uniref:Uncharacterized protein n=1 Tax=Hibiscus sabdariffa TaxID=183260 RepID=A0ABR2CF41_9ROSI
MKRFGLGRVTQWQAGLAELLGSYCLTGSRRIEPALPDSFRPFGFGLCDNGSDEMGNGGCRLKMEMEGDEAWLFRDEWVLQWGGSLMPSFGAVEVVTDGGRLARWGILGDVS